MDGSLENQADTLVRNSSLYLVLKKLHCSGRLHPKVSPIIKPSKPPKQKITAKNPALNKKTTMVSVWWHVTWFFHQLATYLVRSSSQNVCFSWPCFASSSEPHPHYDMNPIYGGQSWSLGLYENKLAKKKWHIKWEVSSTGCISKII